jgi:hypothetical protein
VRQRCARAEESPAPSRRRRGSACGDEPTAVSTRDRRSRWSSTTTRGRRSAPRCHGEDAGDRPAARRRRATYRRRANGAARADTNRGPILPGCWTTLGQLGALSPWAFLPKISQYEDIT